jgi:hypothetical protein
MLTLRFIAPDPSVVRAADEHCLDERQFWGLDLPIAVRSLNAA